ncbi:maleylacetoacetate isomerase [uncultured Caulobacter sp.]|uniref:maleylacetoacetate isomerase n=1 Tax=uncultured Caulobacter sp. TaxID=158749 RepID=UPI0026342AB9|nr:maleylacetoacetate isomerase [uncultured Caulobacter sp.]
MKLVLHSAKRASAPYRVRIGLNLKGLAYELRPVDLAANAHHQDDYRALNAQALVPTLEVDGRPLTQSLAILEWLDEVSPEPALLPAAPYERAIVRGMAEIIACDIHPLNNLRILRQLSALEIGETDRNAWVARWINEGFRALEPMIAAHAGAFAYGDAPGLVDCLLVPQAFNAGRFNVDLSPFPAIQAAVARAVQHPAIAAAHPDHHPER